MGRLSGIYHQNTTSNNRNLVKKQAKHSSVAGFVPEPESVKQEGQTRSIQRLPNSKPLLQVRHIEAVRRAFSRHTMARRADLAEMVFARLQLLEHIKAAIKALTGTAR